MTEHFKGQYGRLRALLLGQDGELYLGTFNKDGRGRLKTGDDHTFKVALKFLPELARKLKGGLIHLAFNFLHEFWIIFMKGMPKLVLLAEFSGETESGAYNQARQAEKSLADFELDTKISLSGYDTEKYWVIRRESFNLLRHKVKNLRTAPFIEDIIVKPEYLPEFLPRLYDILDSYPIIYTMAGHVGDGNFHIIPLMNLADPESRRIIPELSQKVYDLVLKYNGSITGEHNDGLIRTPFLKQMYGEKVYGLFEQVKKLFDPDNIFNPGKKVGANLKYAMEHLEKERE
jgi:FAD/FMN-containing dehydrogenase